MRLRALKIVHWIGKSGPYGKGRLWRVRLIQWRVHREITWQGEVLTVAAQAVGIKGLVIDGGVRDIAALRRRQFPVFSRGISVCGTHKDTLISVGQAIQITGTPVQIGDLVIADDDGVVILPHHCALDVIQKGKAREEKESVMMRQLIEGKTTLELMDLTAWRDKL
jgi:4-hydroxy-4-methyl-2-oxoglutarate aldolase